MPRKAKKTVATMNFDQLFKEILKRNEVVTVKDIAEINTRLDRLEALIKKGFRGRAVSRTSSGKRGGTTNTVLEVIQKKKDGADFKHIQAKTNFDDRKIRNAIYILSKMKKIKRVSRGVYTAT